VDADSTSEGEILSVDARLSHDGGLATDHKVQYAVTVTEPGAIADLLGVDVATSANTVSSGAGLSYTITVTNNFGLPVDNVAVLLRVPAEISFNESTDVDPDITSCGSTACEGSEEALWSLGTLSAGETRIITINAVVASGLDDGRLINAPFRVTADGAIDVIDLRVITPIDN
jgi:hypothetical protein